MTDTLTNGKAPWHDQIYVSGWVRGGGGVHAVQEPATGTQIGSIGLANDADVDNAAHQAAAAQQSWAQMPFDQRAAILRQAAHLLRERAEDFNHWNIRECGSIPPKADWELNASYEQLLMSAALPMQPNGLLFPSSMPERTNVWRRIPIGVVGVIAPWNFPLLLGLRSIAPALALGNAVLLKPDLQSAVTGGLLLAQVFADAGVPPGVFQVLPGGAETGDAIVRHPAVGMISFTGSTAVGRQIGEICGRMLKKVTLELGGNNAIIVLADADLDGAASSGAWGAFFHQGQICMQAGRHLVHRSIADAYAARLVERAQRLQSGNPATQAVHLGPIINTRQIDRVERIVNDSVAAGAKVLSGGIRQDRYYQPTVLMDVTPDMSAFSEEIFGPVAPITVFDTADEAIELAHASEYGLATAIHSADLALANELARRLRSGMVHINDQTVNNEFHVPFGGMGASGNGGRFGGPANIEEFTQTQWISSLDKPIQYPF